MDTARSGKRNFDGWIGFDPTPGLLEEKNLLASMVFAAAA